MKEPGANPNRITTNTEIKTAIISVAEYDGINSDSEGLKYINTTILI